jgi:acyl-coenzyme A thioesterase PaaI-like protein
LLKYRSGYTEKGIPSFFQKDISNKALSCALRDGNIAPPPAAKLVGYRIVDVDAGQAVFELKPSEYHYNPFSTVHGGMLSTLLDTTMAAPL